MFVTDFYFPNTRRKDSTTASNAMDASSDDVDAPGSYRTRRDRHERTRSSGAGDRDRDVRRPTAPFMSSTVARDRRHYDAPRAVESSAMAVVRRGPDQERERDKTRDYERHRRDRARRWYGDDDDDDDVRSRHSRAYSSVYDRFAPSIVQYSFAVQLIFGFFFTSTQYDCVGLNLFSLRRQKVTHDFCT
jgi:hypothetical protein